MKGKTPLWRLVVTLALAIALAGCGHNKDKSAKQVQYQSHMDQAHFFQNQGELKASTQEARSATDLEKNAIAPYLLIVQNLLIAGDASTASNELKSIQQHLPKNVAPFERNRIEFYWVRAKLLEQDYKGAQAHLDKFVKPKKDATAQTAEANNLQGKIDLALNQLDKAKAAFTQASATDVNSVAAQIGLSKVAYRQGDKPGAKSALDKALKLDKDNSQAWLWKAQMAQQEQDWSNAENAYMKALDGIGKYDVMTYQKYQTMSSLIQVLRAENKIQQAFAYEEILAKSGPGTVISNFKAAQKAYHQGNLDEAANHLQEILKQSPGNRQSALFLGLIRYQQGRVSEAEAILKPLEKNGQSLALSKLLAATQIRSGQSQQAQKMLEKLKGASSDPGILALVGVAAINTGQPDVGQKYIEKSLQLAPKNSALRLHYGQWLMSRNDFQGAAEQARQAIRTDPKSVPAHRLLVSAYLRDKAPGKAYQAVEEWGKAQPHSVDAVVTSGDLEFSQGHGAKARADYERAAKLNPHSPQPLIALGNLMHQQGKDNQALGYFEKAVKINPNDQAALLGLVRASGESPAHLQSTLKFLRQQAQDHPESPGPRLVLWGNALREGDFKQSQQLAQEIATLSKNQGATEEVMTRMYTVVAVQDMNQKKFDQAGEVLKQASAQFPDNLKVGLAQARLALSQDDENAALKTLSQLKEKYPQSDSPYLLEAGYRLQKKQYDQAIELFKLARKKSDNPQVWMELANAQKADGQQNQALKTLEKASQTYPDAPAVILQLAQDYQSANETEKAEQQYQKLLKLSPDQPVALNNLAWIYQQKHDKRAADLASRAYQLAPHSAAVADTYGWILLQQGQAEKSVPILEAAHKQAPKQKQIALHLAEAYKQTHQSDKAKAILQKF